MDFLKAEIERKKRQIQEKNVLQPEKKYFKRGDLLAVQVNFNNFICFTLNQLKIFGFSGGRVHGKICNFKEVGG